MAKASWIQIYTAMTLTAFSVHAAAQDQVLVWEDAFGLKSTAGCENVILPDGDNASHQDVIEVVEAPAQREFQVNGSFWQAEREGTDLKAVRCYDGATVRDYILFSVQRPEFDGPIARVGVSADQKLLFKHVLRHSPEEAETAIQAVATAIPQARASLTAGVAAENGDMAYVICTSASELNVRDESLSKVLFKAERFEPVKPVQSFGTDQMQKKIDGHTYTFTKVQVPSRPAGSNTGWIAEDYLKLKSQCAGASGGDAGPVAPIADGWNFPTIKRTTTSYKSGMRKFKAGRSGGRLHAACDLYRKKDEIAQSVNGGKVIRDRYYFYQGTYALEVKHSDGKVVRYGEITGKAAPGTGAGAAVTTGQTIGYIGKVNSNCCEPMLHFEMYSGRGSGPLTTSGNSFSRRSDLIDPSSYLTDWEKAKFGTNY